MLTPLAWLLGGTALLAGLTGAWSPCGFSMVDTLARGGGGRRGVTAVSCATFSAGALLGGLTTFGALALLGAGLRGVGAAVPVLVAAAIAGAAALGEARGVRIVPQVRRQVPEPWRRLLPLPLAAWLYGILLGLGFTTFVLTLAVWALAGIAVALGEPQLGLVIGLGFGIGRALPVVALAPVADRAVGVRAVALMAERPAVLRSLRLADAAALVACTAAIAAGPANAATVVAAGSDPSAAGDDLAWNTPGGAAVLRRGGTTVRLPGRDPAIGGRMLAVRSGSLIVVVRRANLAPVLRLRVPGVDKLAVSDRWLVYRVGGGLWGRRLTAPHRVLRIAAARGDSVVGRPGLNGDTVVYSLTGPGGSAIAAVDLRRRHRRVIRRSLSSQFLNPSLLAGRLLYVGESRCSQLLRLGRPDSRRERFLTDLGPIARHDAGHEPGHTKQGSEPGLCPSGTRPTARGVLWTTALSRRYAYATVLSFGPRGLGNPRILRFRR